MGMAKKGRGNKAIDALAPDVRAQLDAMLDADGNATAIWEEYPAIQLAMSLRTLQEYAKERRRNRKIQIVLDAQAVMDGLLDSLDIDRSTMTRVQQIALGTSLMETINAERSSSRLNGVDAVLQFRKDQRKTEEHAIRMKLGSIKAKVEQMALDARTNKKSAKSGAEAYEEMAKLLDDAIRAGDVK